MSNKDNTFSFEKAENSPGFLLWQVTNLWQRKIRKALTAFDLTHSQYVLLASVHWLSLQGIEITQIVLSNHTKIDPMTTSTVLRGLQTRGLLKRQEHPLDTRAKTIKLTTQGMEMIKEAVKIVESFDHQFFSPLNIELDYFNEKLLLLLSEE